jgi:CRP/FNR family cyclic AMP-dependent transcriptional regulator
MALMDPARLRKLALFAELSDEERDQVARRAEEVEVPVQKHLVDEGELGYEFFVIQEGRAEVRRGDEVIAELGPGDFFGEVALLEEHRRNASVVATEPLRAIVMSRRDFTEMQAEIPSVAARIRQAVEDRRGS